MKKIFIMAISLMVIGAFLLIESLNPPNIVFNASVVIKSSLSLIIIITGTFLAEKTEGRGDENGI